MEPQRVRHCSFLSYGWLALRWVAQSVHILEGCATQPIPEASAIFTSGAGQS
jgi:hypothetical protein